MLAMILKEWVGGKLLRLGNEPLSIKNNVPLLSGFRIIFEQTNMHLEKHISGIGGKSVKVS